jgi:hypothetical protein
MPPTPRHGVLAQANETIIERPESWASTSYELLPILIAGQLAVNKISPTLTATYAAIKEIIAAANVFLAAATEKVNSNELWFSGAHQRFARAAWRYSPLPYSYGVATATKRLESSTPRLFNS